MVNFLQLTRSRLRQKILSYYFTNPTRRLYLRQAASILKEDPGNLSKEFFRLEKEGVFISEAQGNQKHFYLNRQYPLYNELKSILFKTAGVEGRLKDMVGKTRGIRLSFIYGSYAANKENASSDVDLMIVGNPDEDKLLKDVEAAERILGREVNYNIYPVTEFKKRLKNRDSFITNILNSPKMILKGEIGAF